MRPAHVETKNKVNIILLRLQRSMPFCQACGAEIKPGKNFCSNCGTPAALPAEPSPPLAASGPPPEPAAVSQEPAQPVPAAPSHSRERLIIAGVMGAAILGIIIFIGIPLVQPPHVQPAVPVMYPVTVPAPSSPAATHAFFATAVPTAAVVYRAGEGYDLVFSRKYDPGPVRDVFSYTLDQPPLVIECEMNPNMVSREKMVDIGTSSERYITTTYANPSAWLELKIVRADTGKVETMISFSKNYVGMLKQEYTLRAPGNYRFEISGNLVSPDVRLLLKR